MKTSMKTGMKTAMKNANPNDNTSHNSNEPVKQSLNGMISILQFLAKALHDAQTTGYDRDEIAGLWHLLHGVKEAAENCYELCCEEQKE
jgi:hypothetical protein